MASRPILAPFSVIENESMAGNITSDVTVIQNTSMVAYQVTWSGTTPIGEMSVEVSNNYTQNADGTVRYAGDWATVGPFSDTLDVTGNTGTGFIDIEGISAYAIRLVYTRTSGTGTMNAIIAGKVG